MGLEARHIGIRAIAGAALGVLLAACGAEPPPVEAPIRPVRTIVTEISQASRTRTFAGVARAGVESRLSFRVGGTVDAVAVTVGARVQRGDPLARLDPTDYELGVEQAQAAVKQAEAGLRNADASYERVRGLYENRNASKGELDAARAAKESAEAQLEAAQKGLEIAQLNVGYTRLSAPLDGVIAEVLVEVNENVQAGQAVVLLLTGRSDLEIEVAVPEAVIADVREGQRVTARFDALRGRDLRAVVTEVGVAATGTATTFPVTARIEEPDADVRAGMAGEVAFDFDPGAAPRIVVPAVAVLEDRGGRFVWVVEAGQGDTGVVRRREVEVGDMTAVEGGGAGIEILGGLEEGEAVVTAGARRLEDGQRVRLSAPGVAG